MRAGEGQDRELRGDERRAVGRALRAAGSVRSLLDVAAGNGRWLPLLAGKATGPVVAVDLSLAELQLARGALSANLPEGRAAYAASDAGALPFRSQSFDLVVCLGLFPHVRRSGRVRALRELRRVSNRWVLVQYAHAEGLGFLWQRTKKSIGLSARLPRNHLTRREVQAEMRQAGLGVRGFARVGGPFSRTWIVLAEAPSSDWMKS